MAKIEGRPTVDIDVCIRLFESEAAALDALVAYGADTFLKVFYQHLGETYLKPYESGLRSLFKSVRNGEGSVEGILKRAKEARAVFDGKKIAVRSDAT